MQAHEIGKATCTITLRVAGAEHSRTFSTSAPAHYIARDRQAAGARAQLAYQADRAIGQILKQLDA